MKHEKITKICLIVVSLLTIFSLFFGLIFTNLFSHYEDDTICANADSTYASNSIDFNRDIHTYPYYEFSAYFDGSNTSYLFVNNLPSIHFTVEYSIVSECNSPSYYCLLYVNDVQTSSFLPTDSAYFNIDLSSYASSDKLRLEFGFRCNVASNYTSHLYFYEGGYVPGFGEGLAAGYNQGYKKGYSDALSQFEQIELLKTGSYVNSVSVGSFNSSGSALSASHFDINYSSAGLEITNITDTVSNASYRLITLTFVNSWQLSSFTSNNGFISFSDGLNEYSSSYLGGVYGLSDDNISLLKQSSVYYIKIPLNVTSIILNASGYSFEVSSKDIFNDGYNSGYDAGYSAGESVGYQSGLDASNAGGFSWLISSVQSLLNANIFGNFGIGTILYVMLGISFVLMFLKFFAG